MLLAQFMNDSDVRDSCYAQMNVSGLLTRLARTKINICAIGKRHCWMVNASTPHKQHFVGSRLTTGLYERPTEVRESKRIKEFICKYASAGSKTVLYWLHDPRGLISPVGAVTKGCQQRVQLPGCTLEPQGGLVLPKFISGPIANPADHYVLVDGWLESYPTLMRAVKETIDRDLRHPIRKRAQAKKSK